MRLASVRLPEMVSGHVGFGVSFWSAGLLSCQCATTGGECEHRQLGTAWDSRPTLFGTHFVPIQKSEAMPRFSQSP